MKWIISEARIDWLTVTGRTDGKGQQLLDKAIEIGATLLDKGDSSRDSSFQGYKGRVCGSFFYGWRLSGSCVRLGGNVAKSHWSTFASLADNVSRCDLAVTVESTPVESKLATSFWSKLPNRVSTSGRPVEYTLIQTRHGGQTLYIGDRSSDKYGRIYDKNKESKGVYPPGAWRFEVEYKGASANLVAERLLAITNEAQAVYGIVAPRFDHWKCSIPAAVPDVSWTDQAIYARTTNQSRMKWLRESVASTIQKLSTDYTGDEIRTALGLGELPITGDINAAMARFYAMDPEPTRLE